jgi:hypothetical protein
MGVPPGARPRVDLERPSSERLPAPAPLGAWLPFWAKLALFAAAYAASAELGHRLTLQPRPFAAFWPMLAS